VDGLQVMQTNMGQPCKRRARPGPAEGLVLRERLAHRGIAGHNVSAATTAPDAPAPRAPPPAHDLRHFLFRTYVYPYRAECGSLRVPLHQRHLRCHRFDHSV